MLVEIREVRRRYRAEFDVSEAVRVAVCSAMADKYGLADRVWGQFTDRNSSVVIRLRDIGGEVPMAHGAHP